MSLEERYVQATARAEQQKAVFLSSAAAAKARLAPARLKEDLKQKAVDGVLNGSAYVAAKAHQRPIAFGAAAGALVLYLFRRPISALFGRMYVRMKNSNPETSETQDG